MMNGSNDVESSGGYPATPPPAEDMFGSTASGLSSNDERPGLDNGHSLPNVAELKTDAKARGSTYLSEDGEGVGRRTGGWVVWMALFLALVVIGVIVGVAVTVTNNKSSTSTSSSSSTNFQTSAPQPPVIDVKPTDDGKETDTDINTPATPAPAPATAAPVPVAGSAGEERMAQIKSYLVAQFISTDADLSKEGSPQQRALDFMAVRDGNAMEIPVGNRETPEGYDFMTRYVLATLYYSTSGSRWTFDLNFLKPTSVCGWYSVLQYVDMSTEYRGVACDLEENQIVALFMNQNNMEGTLPDELGLLTTLINIDLDLNLVRGPLPDSFQSLAKLENIFFSGNGLTGTIPAWIDVLAKLRNINFSHNLMTGRLPASLGNLQALEGLALDNNMFTNNFEGVFDSSLVPGLRKLEQFYMENNQFTGTMDANFMKEMKALSYLDVSDNRIGGSIPSHLFELPNLLVLDLHDNDFTTLPSQFPANNKLGLLALQKCKFENMKIPTSLANLESLQHLDVSQNKFTGEIPTQLGDMKNMTYLFLAENEFVPNNVPYWIEGLTKLEELSLKSTQRTGPIPDFLGIANSKLILLDLDENKLVGTIPSSLGNLRDLHILLLNRNNLTSVIPTSFGNLKSLKLLFLEANTEISGSLADTFCNNPAFVLKPVIVAGCDICDAVTECCTLCCQPGEECNDGIHVPDLDPIWQLGYNRIFFTFRREDYFMKKGGDGRHLVQVGA